MPTAHAGSSVVEQKADRIDSLVFITGISFDMRGTQIGTVAVPLTSTVTLVLLRRHL